MARYDWNAPTPIPREQVAVNVKLEEENTQLKETIVHLQNRIGAEDLTVDEMQDIQEILMDDDDDDGLEWLQGTLPMPAGQIKSEPIDTDEIEVSSMDTFQQAEDDTVVTNEMQNGSPILRTSNVRPNTFVDSTVGPIASTSSGITGASNVHKNTMDDSSVDTTTPLDAVSGSIEFVLDVRKSF